MSLLRILYYKFGNISNETLKSDALCVHLHTVILFLFKLYIKKHFIITKNKGFLLRAVDMSAIERNRLRGSGAYEKFKINFFKVFFLNNKK